MSSENNRSPNTNRRRPRAASRSNDNGSHTPGEFPNAVVPPVRDFEREVQDLINGTPTLSPTRPRPAGAARLLEQHRRHVLARRREENRGLGGDASAGVILARPQPEINSTTTGSAATLDWMQQNRLADRQLAEAIANSRALLSQTEIPTLSPERGAVPNSESQAELRRASKRRKLDDDASSSPKDRPKFVPVNYGYQGRVVPGDLNMAIKFCDGGTYETGTASENFAVENILLDDDSVYCTKDSRCNLILQHEGERPFTLKELIIKAPREGYDSPVKEGMVFVGMDADETMMRTAKHKVKYGKRKHAPVLVSSTIYRADGTSTTRTGPSAVYGPRLRDNYAILPREFKEQANGYNVTTIFSEDSDSDEESLSSEEDSTPRPPRRNMDGSVSSLSREQASRRRRQSPLRLSLTGLRYRIPARVIAEFSNMEDSDDENEELEEDDDDDEQSILSLRSREAMLAHVGEPDYQGFEFEDSDYEGDDVEHDEDENVENEGSSSPEHSQAGDDAEADDEGRKEPESTAQPEGGAGAAGESQNSNGTTCNGSSSNQERPKMLAAHTRFTFQPSKSKCRMVFDPPISARYLLLKLWCPDGGKRRLSTRPGMRPHWSMGNIDIQSVVVKGWCGPRAFHSVELA